MDPKKAEEHATAVARELVARGLATQEAVRQAFFEYVEIVRKQGVKGSFPQFLASRGVVDKAKLATLQTLTPSSDRFPNLQNSATTPGSDRLPAGTAAGLAGTQTFQPGQTRSGFAALPPVPPPPSAGTPEEAEGGVTVQLSPGTIAAQLADAARRRPGTAPSPPPAPTIRMPAGGTPPPPAFTPQPPARTPAPTPASLTPPPPAFTPPPVSSSGSRPGSARGRTAPLPADSGSLEIPPSSEGFDPQGKGPVGAPLAPRVEEFQLSSQDDSAGDPVDRTHRRSGDETVDEDAAAVKALLARGDLQESAESTNSAESEESVEVPEVALESADGLQENGEPPTGARIGKYTIVSPLGRGGMAVVYRVKAAGSERELAMKVLTGGDRPGGEKRRARFRREVRAVQRLDHANIVKIHDAGKSGPLDFYVMDLIEGEDFEKALQKNKYELEKRLEIIEGICRAMAHAHERGVIHRDLKPQNVLLDARAKPKVVDFGLAKVTNDEVSLTRTNTALGTPFYMAPEQHKNAKDIDQRADVFALGVMIYECATGQRPFTGETAAEVGHKVLTVDPPLPSKLKPKVPPAIDAIVAKAIEKDPTHRYASAGALLVDLIRARAGKEVSAKGSVGLQADARKFYVRNRAAVLAGGAVAVVFLPIVLVLALRGDGGKNGGGGGKNPSPKPSAGASAGDVKPSPEPTGGKASPTPAPSSEPGVSPTPRPQASPSTAPTPSPSSAPSPGASAPPRPSPTPTPSAEPSPASTSAPTTPLDLVRAEFKFPEEPAESGAEAQLATLSPEQRRDFWSGLDRLVDAPLARGDLDAARDGLSAMASDPEVQNLHRLARDEIQHDLDLLGRLRRLVVERVRADEKALPGLDLFDAGRGSNLRGPPKLVEGDYLQIQGGQNGRAVVDPLALATSTLRSFLGSEAAGVKLALGVLIVHRGEDADSELKPLADRTPVAAHRLTWAKLAKEGREAAAALSETAAADEWRQVLADKAKISHPGTLKKLEDRLDAFLASFGRWDSFRSRRLDWLQTSKDAISWDRRIAATSEEKQKKLSLDYHWRIDEKKHARDLEVSGRDPKAAFKADWQTAGITVENAQIAFPADDRGVYWAKAEFVSEENGPVALLAGDHRIDLDPKTEWSWKDESDKVCNHARSKGWSLVSTHALEWGKSEEKEPRFTGHLGREDLFLQTSIGKQERPLSIARNRIGFSADRGRLSDLRGSIARAPRESSKDRLIEARYTERYLVEARAERLRKLARVVVLTGNGRSVAPAREVLLEGDWKATSEGLEGSGPATLTTLRDTADGELSFEVQPDDGPGVLVEIGRQGSAGDRAWRLPGTTLAPHFRSVVVDFDLGKNGGTATCVVDDALRLESRTKLAADRVPVRIVLDGRTRATIRNLKVVELSRGK